MLPVKKHINFQEKNPERKHNTISNEKPGTLRNLIL
jgi:hypothetical protein